MRRIILILILLVFSLSEFKPLVYIAEYAINYEYITTELCVEKDEVASCCKGKCYLTKQLSKVVTPDDDSSSEKRTPKIEWEKIPMIVYPSEHVEFFLTKDKLDSPALQGDVYYDDISIKIPTPPPRA